MMFTAFISLLFGWIIGYMAQRSRMCFVGGMRDFVLVKDTHLLKGLLSFFVTAAILFPLAGAMGGDTYGYPWFAHERARETLEMSRHILGLAPCWLPEEAVMVIESETAKVNGMPLPGGYVLSYSVLTAMASALGLGYMSTVANGCPLRQHVMAASGNKSALVYLAGFYLAAITVTYLPASISKLVFP